ncbi:hypothetical protein GCM10011445_27870 [Pseudocitrobacter faecalis]|nr:hypothetical protein GCM10011445_27870 [Pseudocitrobacter faecalis]
MENESQTGCLVEQEVQDILRDWVDSHRGGVSRTQQFTDEQAARPQEKLSRTSREHEK